MQIDRIICGSLYANCYIIYEGEKGYIVDPGDQGGKILSYVKSRGLNIEAILLTHHHYDHTGAVNEVVDALGCPVYIHRKDRSQVTFKAVTFEEGQNFTLGQKIIQVLHTPGHTMGSVCFYCQDAKIAITGDTIFDTDLGRTDLSDGNPSLMEESILNVVSKWDDSITIYPGHDEKATMATVRKYNTEYLDILKRNRYNKYE